MFNEIKRRLRATFYPLPALGAMYVHDESGDVDPFCPPALSVRVIEIKKGWVRYVRACGAPDSTTAPRRRFNYRYKRIS